MDLFGILFSYYLVSKGLRMCGIGKVCPCAWVLFPLPYFILRRTYRLCYYVIYILNVFYSPKGGRA